MMGYGWEVDKTIVPRGSRPSLLKNFKCLPTYNIFFLSASKMYPIKKCLLQRVF